MTSPASFPEDVEILAALLDHLPEAVCLKDERHRFVRVNRTMADWYGLPDPAAAVGKSEADYFTREIAKAVDEAEREVLQSGSPRTVAEEKRAWPCGRVLWTSTARLPLRNAAGAVTGTLGIIRDIGPELQAQQEVRRAELLYRGLVDGLPQSFFRKDLEGRVTFANRRYCEVLGKKAKDLLGKTDFDLFPEHLARKYREDDLRVLQTGVTLDVVEAHKPPGKKVIHVRVVKTPVYDADKRAIGVQGIFWEVPGQSEEPATEKAPAPRKKKPKPRGRKK